MKKHAEQESQQERSADMEQPEGKNESGAQSSAGTQSPGVAAAEASTGGASGSSASGAGSADAANADGREARIAELERLTAELQDQYLRKAADFDNYRKRMIREKQEAIDYANASLLGDLVQVLDDFDRAIDAAGAHEAGSAAAGFAEGVSMIRNQFASMLESKYSLAYYPAKGTPFDPNIHEAIATAPSADVSEPTVAEEYVKGYKLKDRVIRHSKVMVHTPAANGQ
jgi:molecular chaperone GrpE